MLEFLLKTDDNDAIAILKKDHEKVKDLFDKFDKAESLREKKKIVAQAIMELKIHAEIEEKIFYPTVRPDIKEDIMNEADEEHHVAKLLIAELDQMDGSEDHYEAKFTVLAENIRHHIKEEERDMLPQARSLPIDFIALGKQLLTSKEQLKKSGVPASAEEKLMTRGFTADSPARNAKLKKAVKTVTTKGKAAKKTIVTKIAQSHKPRVRKVTAVKHA